MSFKELAVPVYLKDGTVLEGWNGSMLPGGEDVAALAVGYSNDGADAIVLYDFSDGDAAHDLALHKIKEMAQAVDIPVFGGGNIRRMEDVKKLIYAGCQKVFLNYAKESNIELTHEVSGKFGKEKIMASVRSSEALTEAFHHAQLIGGILLPYALAEEAQQKAAELSEEDRPGLLFTGSVPGDWDGTAAQPAKALGLDACVGICEDAFQKAAFDFMALKHELKEEGIPMNTYEASLSFAELEVGSDGLLPVVVQDYKTQEVLMVAYMNQEAFEQTIRTGRMTYWSRSRQELWVKGLTSGHFQYVKELRIDCDNDTLLAKVHQIGAACHTGNRSCFYRPIMKKEYDDTNPLKVFEDVYAVIQDRKIHPKEGSYTNYLFDKGIDKILKKVGEEATEIVIAAKNPDPEEIKYEISDFLYHVMVLMAERGVSWEDITKELARR